MFRLSPSASATLSAVVRAKRPTKTQVKSAAPDKPPSQETKIEKKEVAKSSPVFFRDMMIPFVQALAFPGGPYNLIDSTAGTFTVIVRGINTTTSGVFLISPGSVIVVSSTGPGQVALNWDAVTTVTPQISFSDDTPADTFHTMVIDGF